jgi:hypothetical protein
MASDQSSDDVVLEMVVASETRKRQRAESQKKKSQATLNGFVTVTRASEIGVNASELRQVMSSETIEKQNEFCIILNFAEAEMKRRRLEKLDQKRKFSRAEKYEILHYWISSKCKFHTLQRHFSQFILVRSTVHVWRQKYLGYQSEFEKQMTPQEAAVAAKQRFLQGEKIGL